MPVSRPASYTNIFIKIEFRNNFFNENTGHIKVDRVFANIYKLNDNEHLKREDKRISFEKRIFKVRQIVHKMQL